MKLQAKLMLHSLISILLAIFIIIYIIIQMLSMQATARAFSDTLIKVEQFNSSLVSYQQSLGNFGRNSTNNNYIHTINKYKDVLEKSSVLESISETNSNPKEQRRIKFIQKKINNMDTSMQSIVDKENASIEAMQLSTKIFGILNDVYLLQLTLDEQYDILTKENNNRIVSISITSGITLLFVSSIFSIILTGRIVSPVKKLNAYSQKIASGDLTLKELKVVSNDEVGQLTHTFNLMRLNLIELIAKIQNNADELKQKNESIHDSISYAKRIQETIIPDQLQLEKILDDHFLIWKPRDVVGGDFLWCHQTKNGVYIAVGDCTGHGVPGALMTTLCISALNNILENGNELSPGHILERLNRMIKKNLNQNTDEFGLTDDGLDIGLCYIERSNLTFSGSKISLLKSTHEEELIEIKGDKKSIGYRRTPNDYVYTNHQVICDRNTTFYLTTDGYIDQNGGFKNYSLGRSKFANIISEVSLLPLKDQKESFIKELHDYMGEETQRDDITVLGFKVL